MKQQSHDCWSSPSTSPGTSRVLGIGFALALMLADSATAAPAWEGPARRFRPKGSSGVITGINAALRVALTNGHPDLATLGLADFTAVIKAEPLVHGEGYALTLECSAQSAAQVAGVDFQGWYYGYDENGNLKRQDWHGFTKNRLPVGTLGEAAAPPFAVTWDTSIVPAQLDVAVRAVVRFEEDDPLTYLTAATPGLAVAPRNGSKVVLFAPHDLPAPFWSRANQKRICHLDVDLDPSRIERAELHVVTWTGGAGTVKDYFTLNGVHYPVAEGARHELVYSRLPVEPRNLKRGLNRIELLSATEHHGIEVMVPGPALLVRYSSQQN